MADRSSLFQWFVVSVLIGAMVALALGFAAAETADTKTTTFLTREQVALEGEEIVQGSALNLEGDWAYVPRNELAQLVIEVDAYLQVTSSGVDAIYYGKAATGGVIDAYASRQNLVTPGWGEEVRSLSVDPSDQGFVIVSGPSNLVAEVLVKVEAVWQTSIGWGAAVSVGVFLIAVTTWTVVAVKQRRLA